MEGVGVRLGRSSSRYGTTTVFSGPVRKWKKDWVPVNPSSSSSSSSSSASSSSNNANHLSSSSFSSLANGGSINTANGSVSHLRLFKWTPVSQSSDKENSNINNKSNSNNTAVNNSPSKDSAMEDAVSEEAPRRKFKFIPIALLEDQKKEAEEIINDEAEPTDTDKHIAIPASRSDDDAEKPDINNVPMEENQVGGSHTPFTSSGPPSALFPLATAAWTSISNYYSFSAPCTGGVERVAQFSYEKPSCSCRSLINYKWEWLLKRRAKLHQGGSI